MEGINKNKINAGERKPRINSSIHLHFFCLTDKNNAKLLSIFETSRTHNKAKFIIALLFRNQMKGVKIDKGKTDFYMLLTTLYIQF